MVGMGYTPIVPMPGPSPSRLGAARAGAVAGTGHAPIVPIIRKLSESIQNEVQDHVTNNIMSTRKVVSRVFFSGMHESHCLDQILLGLEP